MFLISFLSSLIFLLAQQKIVVHFIGSLSAAADRTLVHRFYVELLFHALIETQLSDLGFLRLKD